MNKDAFLVASNLMMLDQCKNKDKNTMIQMIKSMGIRQQEPACNDTRLEEATRQLIVS